EGHDPGEGRPARPHLRREDGHDRQGEGDPAEGGHRDREGQAHQEGEAGPAAAQAGEGHADQPLHRRRRQGHDDEADHLAEAL
ncbi:MAG: hypothetical protein AVDCRST_MAG30-2417, partial [uncultured Solirubrobacteraceae bacterium]